MKFVIQKVLEASVKVDNKIVSSINEGLLVLIGFKEDDTKDDFDKYAKKLINLRIFEDSNNKMNLSIKDLNKDLLIVSQFTLYGDTNEGNRPSFTKAMNSDRARQYYEDFIKVLKTYKNDIKTGIFQADMKVNLINDGPCTIIIDND